MGNPFKEYCRDIANIVRKEIDAIVVMKNLTLDSSANMQIFNTKKNYQDIEVRVNTKYSYIFYFRIRIESKKKFVITSSHLLQNKMEVMYKEKNGMWAPRSVDFKTTFINSIEELIDFMREYI